MPNTTCVRPPASPHLVQSAASAATSPNVNVTGQEYAPCKLGRMVDWLALSSPLLWDGGKSVRYRRR